MAAAAEGDMQARVVALDLELAGGFEPARIAVGGAVGDVQEGAGGDVDAADLRRLLRQAEVALDRAFDAQAFLAAIRDEAAILAQADRKRGVEGQSVSVGVAPGGRRIIKKKNMTIK